MNAFRFPLEKVLEWRRTQLQVEEARFKQQMAEIAGLDRAREGLEAAGSQAEMEVRGGGAVAGRELAALGGYREHLQQRRREIAGQRAECERKAAAQEAVMLEARRRSRLLERLRERRLEEWRRASDRELEELASEAFLARRNRQI